MPMTNPRIKFSHTYLKWMGKVPRTATLLGILADNFENLPKSFLAYDTTYEQDGKLLHYELPAKGACLILLFASEDGKSVFTTVRTFNPDKAKFYSSLVGKVFDVEVSP